MENIINFEQTLEDFKPSRIVELLDNYIVGQEKAKKLLAIALRNRIRRKYVSDEMKDEILPKNILMIGPTGVGKTELARRMASIIDAPFVKVEATKFTERGYVGRDVEYMIRALVNHSINLVKSRLRDRLKSEIEEEVTNYIVNELYKQEDTRTLFPELKGSKRIKNEIRKGVLEDWFDHFTINIKIKKKNPLFPGIPDFLPGFDEPAEINAFFSDLGMGGLEETKEVSVKEAKEILFQEFMDNKINNDEVIEIGLKWAQEMGIVFIDEIDKISDKAKGMGPEVSREGVQRDLLPIVEGTNVNTKYGIVKTDHMLFIGAGAFHVCKPSDMIPELQGRFPIRVELERLSKEHLKRILLEPKNSIIKQYKALLKTEGVNLEFENDAIDKIVEIAENINNKLEDIGARRLHTVMEYLLEEISFNAPDMKNKKFIITKKYVEERLSSIVEDTSLTQYIL